MAYWEVGRLDIGNNTEEQVTNLGRFLASLRSAHPQHLKFDMPKL